MKHILLALALTLWTLSFAKEVRYDYSFTPLVGYNINEGSLDLDNHSILGAEVQFNKIFKIIKPELSVMYSRGNYNSTDNEPKMYRFALNGIHEYDKIGLFIPIAKAGLGYRTLSIKEDGTTGTTFLNTGIGAKVPLSKHFSLKAEALYMCDYNSGRYDNNLAFLLGLNIGFGGVTYIGNPTPAHIEPVDGDDDNDGILNSIDKCPNSEVGISVDANGCLIDEDDDIDGILNSIDECPDTKRGVDVDEQGCFVDGDDDNDGILNSLDKCPDTKEGATVDEEGCFVDGDDDNDGILNSIDECPNTSDQVNSIDEVGCVKDFNMQITFENKSFTVDEQSNQNIERFAEFLNSNMIFNARIIGYTDSVGKESDNQILSKNRAEAVQNILIENGVSADRITAEGKGEVNFIADNKTPEGRAQNRRIEAELSRIK